MDDDPPPSVVGLRRSKRNNKYHLNVASLLLSSSSTIRRDVSPPSPAKAQSHLKRREKAKLLTTTTASSTTTIAVTTTTETNSGGSALTIVSSTPTTTRAKNTMLGMDSSASSTATAMTTNESLTTVSNQVGEPMTTMLMANIVEGTQLKGADIQLPDRLLEDEEDPCDGETDRCHTTTADLLDQAPSSVDTKSGAAICMDNDGAPPSAAAADSVQIRLKRKRKVPLKHRDYFNGVEAEDSENDEFEEQSQLKAVRVEYTAPEGNKLDDHSCPKCPAIFDSRVGLTNHLKLHGSDKEFPCELCDFSCTNKKTMRQHRRVHGLSRRSRNNNIPAASTNVVVKSELKGAAAPFKWSETLGKSSTAPRQWAKQCCVNLDKLTHGHRKEVTKTTATTSTTTVFKPISSSNIFANKICSTVADVAKLVTQMYQQQQQRRTEDEEDERRRHRSKREEDDEADGMPVLEQQQQQQQIMLVDDEQQLQQRNTKGSNNSANQPLQKGNNIGGRNADILSPAVMKVSNGIIGTISVRKVSSTSTSGAGRPVYDRNTVQCSHCPFRTQSRRRLQPHLKGHTRTYGYQCSACGFKSDSSGFLRRHTLLHDELCKWPPDYVGVPNNERLLAQLLERRCATSAKENAANNSAQVASSSPSLGGCCEESKQSMAKDHPQPVLETTTTDSINTMHRLIKMEMIEFNEDEHDQIVADETNNNSARPSSVVGGGAATPIDKFCWTGQMIADRWCAYQKQCRQIRSHGHCSSSTSTESMLTSQPQHQFLFFCRRCQLFCRSGPAHLALHNARHHRIMGSGRLALCRELLAERLAWRDDRGDGIELEFTTLLSKEDVDRRTTSPPSSADASVDSLATTMMEASAVGKVYCCRNCPFSTDQIFRLQKHENKHLFKSEHQCSNCSFSCRSLDILAQHKRLHEDITAEQQYTSSNRNNDNGDGDGTSPPPATALLYHASSSSMQTEPTSPSSLTAAAAQQHQQMALSSTRLAPIRRNEAHYCPHCPYSSKHNCDMKAHMRMHEVRSKFACPLCTYSSKRQNALIAHEQLHRMGPLLGSPAVLGPRGAKCRRLKRVILLSRHHHHSFNTSLLIGERIRFDGARTHFYRCALRQCGEEVPFCADLLRHARNHRTRSAMPTATTATPSLFRCDHCTFVTSLEHRLKAHQLVTHNRHHGGDESSEEKNSRTDAGIFNCKECPFATLNYAKFWNHRQKHKRTNRFTCTHCSFSSGSLQCYAEHIVLHGGNTCSNDSSAQSITTAAGSLTEGIPLSATCSGSSTHGGGRMSHTLTRATTKIVQRSEGEDGRGREGMTTSHQPGVSVHTTQMTSCGISQPNNKHQTVQLRRSPIFQQDKFDQFDAALPPYGQSKLVLGMDVGSSDSSSTTATASSSASSKIHCCTECPFETVHSVLLKLHTEMHRNGMCRPFSCALCTFGCFSAESLHAHLALHASATAAEMGGGSVNCDGGTQTDPGGTEAGGVLAMVDGGPPSVQNNFSSATMVSSSTLYACSQCSFKSTELELFLNHRKEHVQLIQQRLITIIKRAAVMENVNPSCIGNGATKMDKLPKANCSGGGKTVDKQHYCTRCSFRCDSVQAFTRHWEHHCIDNCRSGIFKCNACDYSSDTRNVVLFHEHNHHLDIPLTSLCKNIELVKEQQRRSAVEENKTMPFANDVCG